MTVAEDQSERAEVAEPVTTNRVRWPVLVAAVAAGVLCALGAFGVLSEWIVVDGQVGDQFLADLLVTIGSTLALAAIVFFLERQFLKTTEVKIQELKTGVTAQLAETRSELFESFDQKVADALQSINEAYEQRVADQKSAYDDLLEDIREAPDYQKVTEAIERATGINAIALNQVTVKSASVGGGRVTVAYTPADLNTEPFLSLQFTETRYSHVEWSPEEDAATVLARLHEAGLRNGGKFARSELIPDEFFRNLTRAISVGTEARKWDPNAGAVIEMINDDLLVFQTGIYRASGEVVADSVFFSKHPSTQEYVKPPGFSDEGWQEVIEIGWEHFHPRAEAPWF